MTVGGKALVSSPLPMRSPSLPGNRGTRSRGRRARYRPNPIRAPAAPASTTSIAHSRALAPTPTHRLIDKRSEPLPRPPANGPAPSRMGPTRRRARDPLPVHRGGWHRRRRRRSADGRVRLRAARNVATVRCVTDRGDRGVRELAVARGSAEPGGRALWRLVPRACR
jgi:hypothetical protein